MTLTVKYGLLFASIGVWLLSPSSTIAQGVQPDTLFARLLRQGTYPLQLDNQQFSGLGWDKLQKASQASQVVLIGEDHGIAQIPVLTAALAHHIKPKLYVAEVDPYTAQTLTELLKTPGLPIAHQQRYFHSLSFYSWAQEYQLLEQLHGMGTQIAGLEQINYAFAGQLFTQMAQQAQQSTTKTYLAQQAARYQREYEAAMRQHTYVKPSQASIDSLQAMTVAESPMLQKMVRDFTASYQIYDAIERRTGSHQKRINLMKRTLLETMKTVEGTSDQSLPRMLFKFGANHMARGLSMWSGVYDVGNLIVNLTDAQDQKSLHIIVMGKQGNKAGYADIDNRAKEVAVSYSATDNVFLKPFFDQTTTHWQVFDLRFIRQAIITDKLQVSDQQLEAMILGYDYLVVIPETTASRPFWGGEKASKRLKRMVRSWRQDPYKVQ